MEDNNVYHIKFEKVDKKATLKEKAKRKLEETKVWLVNNRDTLMLATPGIIGAGKFILKRMNLGKEQHLKENYCYDRSLGHYWRLKRPLSNKEWLEIDRRKKNGERLADILRDFKVLK